MTTAELTRHPWNTSFEWPLHDGPFRRVTPAQAAQYDTNGYFLLEDVFDVATLAELRDIIEPHEREVNDFLRQIDGGRISVARADALTVTLHLSTKNEIARRFCGHPVFADLCHDLIGPDARVYWDQAVYKMPHTADPVPWHQDNGYTYVEPQAYLTCWVPLVDATLENGCVWVMPGVHRTGTLAHRETVLGQECIPEGTDGAVAVEAPAGSVVVFTSLTPHRTGPNETDDVRSSYILQYAPDGAEALEGTPDGAPVARRRQNDPDRQFLVVRDGQPVSV